jgi:uncharacterized membrane protein
MSFPKIEIVIATIFLLAAFVLRVGVLTKNGLWVDEVYTLDLVQQSVAEIINRTSTDVHPPLYYLIVRPFWLALQTPWAIRVPSLLFGLFSLLVIYQIGRDLGGPRVAVMLAGLLALSPFHVHYCIEGRNYAFGMLLVLLLLWGSRAFFIDDAVPISQRLKSMRFWVYLASAIAAPYTHNLLALAVFCLGVTLMLMALARGRFALFCFIAAAHATAALLFLPWLLIIQQQVAIMGGALNWMDPPRPEALFAAFSTDLPFGSHHVAPYLSPLEAQSSKETDLYYLEMSEFVLLLGALLGIVAARGARTESTNHRALLILAIVLLLLPLMLSYVISAYYVRIFFPQRFALFQLPGFFILIAVGLNQFRNYRWLAYVLWGLILFTFLEVNYSYYRRVLHRETPQAMQAVDKFLRDGEPLYYTTEAKWSLNELELSASKYLPNNERRFLYDLYLSLDNAETSALPDRLVVFDWMAAHDKNSGKHGTMVYKYLMQNAQSRLLYLPQTPMELRVFFDIDWDAMKAIRAEHFNKWNDLLELPWTALRDTGGEEFLWRLGWTDPPTMNARAMSRWMTDGESEFYSDKFDRPLEPGAYWLVSSIWRQPWNESLAMKLKTSVRAGEGSPAANLFLPRLRYNLLMSPLEVTPHDAKFQTMHVVYEYDTWIPALYGPGEREPRGHVMNWYGLLRRDQLAPEEYSEPPVFRWQAGSTSAADTAERLEFTESDWQSTGSGWILNSDEATLSLKLDAEMAAIMKAEPSYQFDLIVALDYIPETASPPSDWTAERIELQTGSLDAEELIPWPKSDDITRAKREYHFALPLHKPRQQFADDFQSLPLQLNTAGEQRGTWVMRGLYVVPTFASLREEALYPFAEIPPSSP